MRASLLLSVLRPAGPVAVGISLGFTLSLLSVTWVEEPCGPGPPQPGDSELPPRGNTNAARRPNSVQPGAEREKPGAGEGAGENWEPRVLPYHPAQPGQAAKKAVRTRYISTELGIRQRLLVAVLTSQATLPTLGVAVNRTLGHRLERVVFLTGARGRRAPPGMAVVTLGEERPIGHLHLALRHLLEQHGDDFDWFFLVPDTTYTEAHGLARLTGHLSLASAAHLYLGRPQDFIGGEPTPGRYCHGGFGVLLSRMLLQQLRPHLEGCRNDIVSARPDEWLGRCILDATGVGCTGDHEGVHYSHLELSPGEPVQEGDPRFRSALTAHPVRDPVHMYQLHKAFARAELERTYQEIQELQWEIQNTSHLAVDGDRAAAWPVGIPAPSRPASRFEVLRWDYFTEQHAFSCADGSPRCPLRGADRADVADVLGTALEELNRRYHPALRLQKQQLVNGYRRFDPARGMEYMLDLQLEALTPQGGRRPLTRRVQLLRPLSRVEILPVPYVTEASRLTVLLPLAAAERDLAPGFLEAFATAALEPGDAAAALTLLLLYEPRQAQRAAHADVFAPVKAHVAELERRFPSARVPWLSVQTAAPSPLRLMDLLSKKHPLDTLFLLAGPDTVLTPDFLNRCRMHAISGWQAFFPMHFQAFHPAVAPPQGPGPPELGRDTGHFDRQAASEACFYNSDYVAARGRLAAASEQEEELLESLDVYELFLHFSSLHVLRAVEPALLQRYRAQTCSARLSEDLYHRCRQSVLEGLGSRTQLAMLLFEQEQGNST
ncbi:chondroitin sulfate synthase 2 [Symphalangus syndactylus]|uniref:chondroitin sulfate synthase 2 n=1 Tax=Symphalangus syndactylus TaxID=9590 RepID=UPI002443509B|nr:chondroitin sulfate synthase 2 [Symphalangus syndactylus]